MRKASWLEVIKTAAVNIFEKKQQKAHLSISYNNVREKPDFPADALHPEEKEEALPFLQRAEEFLPFGIPLSLLSLEAFRKITYKSNYAIGSVNFKVPSLLPLSHAR